jgi:dCTP deaminase
MLLSDRDIQWARVRDELEIEPWDPGLLNPASLDVRLNAQLRVPRSDVRMIDTADVPENYTELVTMDRSGYVLFPGDFVLGSTLEHVVLRGRYVARLEGKSSLGRLGLTVHVTAGFVDPGFCGDVTLEIVNQAPYALRLHAGMPIAQLAFESILNEPSHDYSQTGRYQGQSGPTESRYRINRAVSV